MAACRSTIRHGLLMQKPRLNGGDTYNSVNWKSNLEKAKSDIEQDWRDYKNTPIPSMLLEKVNAHTVSPGNQLKLEHKR